MVGYDQIRSGSVIRYPYLWMREAKRGETSGRKDRPVAVAIRKQSKQGDVVVLLPITSQPPQLGQVSVELPDTEKRRAGLDESRRLWIILNEYNYDLVGRSFYLEPQRPLGHLGRAFFESVLERFAVELPKAPRVDRT